VKRYKLKLTSLKFISPVDAPAQETAAALLLKRAGVSKATARVVKVDDELGLVFCWAFTTKSAGAEYFDLHGDNIAEDDLVKVCAEFMAGAAAVDEMHDGNATGRTVFGMPMTAEIAKAFGVETETEGFMVAIKPAPEVFAKFKSGEYTGVSIEGTGIREEVVSARKRAALTTSVAGHTHLIHGIDDAMSGYTSGESLPGTGNDYGRWHSHAWLRNEDGSITIGEQEGHTHEVAAQSSSAKRAPGTPPIGNSTTAQQGATVKAVTHQEPPKMDPTAQIASLQKQLAAALALASMTDVQKAHRASLSAPAAEAFDALTPEQRAAAVDVAKTADAVVYTCLDGTEIRKSHGEITLRLAKSADEATRLAKAEAAKREEVELQKRADTVLKHFGGTVVVRAAVLKAVDGIADEPTRKAAHESLAGADAACAELAKAQGANPEQGADGSTPIAKFNAGLAAFAKAASKSVALAAADYVQTPEGADLYVAAYPTRPV
jgi:hypothetical protein